MKGYLGNKSGSEDKSTTEDDKMSVSFKCLDEPEAPSNLRELISTNRLIFDPESEFVFGDRKDYRKRQLEMSNKKKYETYQVDNSAF